MADARGPRREKEPFGLYWALGISIAVHLLLVLLTVWAPISASQAQTAPLEETSIEFSFVQPSDTSADEPASDFPPEPTPPQPAAVPDVIPPGPAEGPPAPDVIDVPLQEAPPEIEQPIEEPAPLEPPQEQPPPDPAPEEAPSETPSETLEEQLSAELPPDPASETTGPTEAPPQQTQETRPRLDVNSALRDFGRSISRRPPPSKPPSTAGGGSPNNVFVPDFSEVPSTGFGMGNLRFESTDFDWADYGRQIYMAIWRAWHNRLYVTTNEFDKWSHQRRSWYLDHGAAVRFVIERNGQVSGIAIEAESGCLPLDRSAVDALEEVLLPPLPAAFPRDREVVHARFITRGDVRSMKEILTHYKRMGLF